MKNITIKNRRAKISPGGVITLSVAARRTLGMNPGEGARVTVAVEGNLVKIAQTGQDGGFRISKKGQMALRGKARGVLEAGSARHYWMELDDNAREVRLHPHQ